MKAMNYESSKWSRDAIDDVVVDEETLARRRRRKRNIIIAWWRRPARGRRAVHDGRQRREGRGARRQGRPAAAGRDRDRPRPPGRRRADLRDRLARPRAATCRSASPARAARSMRVLVEPGQWVARRPDARDHRPLGPGAGSGAARRPDRGRARRSPPRPEPSSTAPRRWSAAASSARPIIDRKRATRDAAAARVRVAQAQLGRDPRPDRPARHSRADRRPRAHAAASRPARSSAPARAPCSASPQGGEMELLARLPQTDLARLSVGVPVHGDSGRLDTSPIRAPSGRSRRSSIRRPARASPASSSPTIATCGPGGFASARDPRRLDERAAAARIGGAERRCAAISSIVVDNQNKVVRRDVRIGEVTDQRRRDRRAA